MTHLTLYHDQCRRHRRLASVYTSEGNGEEPRRWFLWNSKLGLWHFFWRCCCTKCFRWMLDATMVEHSSWSSYDASHTPKRWIWGASGIGSMGHEVDDTPGTLPSRIIWDLGCCWRLHDIYSLADESDEKWLTGIDGFCRGSRMGYLDRAHQWFED